MLLRPLHLMLFSLLRKIPQDATFDQTAGVRRGQRMVKRSGYAASFDLSAATDRLPISVQKGIIDFLVPGIGVE